MFQSLQPPTPLKQTSEIWPRVASTVLPASKYYFGTEIASWTFLDSSAALFFTRKKKMWQTWRQMQISGLIVAILLEAGITHSCWKYYFDTKRVGKNNGGWGERKLQKKDMQPKQGLGLQRKDFLKQFQIFWPVIDGLVIRLNADALVSHGPRFLDT